MWPVRIPTKKEKAIAQKESLEEHLEPPGIGCKRYSYHKRHLSKDADLLEIT
jgi:hypothetical protein